MLLIRRAVFRAASLSTTSVRTLNTSTPFALRSKTQTQQSFIIPSAFRRYSDDAEKGESVRTSNGEDSAVNAAVDSAAFDSAAVDSAYESFDDSASESFDDGASQGYTPREPGQYDGNRGASRTSYGDGGYGGRGGDRGGRSGGDRGGYAADHGGRAGERFGGARDMRGAGSFERPQAPPSNGIYVGNLLFEVTAADLEKVFAEFGSISKVTLATDNRGMSKGFGYVEYETVEQAAKAIEAKHDTQFEGRRVIVNYMNQNRKRTDRAPENPPSKTIFIGNLAFEMSDADLNKIFRDIRNVIDVRVAIDRRTGQPRGFAHADFVDVESAIKGMEALAGKEIYGRQLRLDYSAGISRNRGDGGAPRGGDGNFGN